jgi:trehalose/maltose hydrolase-like predicted phosphorylase
VDGRVRRDESLVNLPNWLPLTVRADDDGPWLAPDTWQTVHQHVALDLRRGLHVRELVVEDPRNRRTRIRQERLVSMDRPHLACLRTTVTPQNWSGRLHVRSLLDGRVSNNNVAEFATLARHHLTQPVTGRHGDTCWLVSETNQSRVGIAVAARTALSHDEASAGRSATPDASVTSGRCRSSPVSR